MRDEYGSCHRGQDAARRAAKYEFTKPRMPVAAHHDHARRTIRDTRQNDIGHVDISRRKDFDPYFDAVTGKVTGDFDAANLLVAPGFLVGNDEQFSGERFLQHRQCIIDGTRRGAASVPAAHNPTEIRSFLLDVGDNDDRPSGLEQRRLD